MTPRLTKSQPEVSSESAMIVDIFLCAGRLLLMSAKVEVVMNAEIPNGQTN